jgi:hypothetical protein
MCRLSGTHSNSFPQLTFNFEFQLHLGIHRSRVNGYVCCTRQSSPHLRRFSSAEVFGSNSERFGNDLQGSHDITRAGCKGIAGSSPEVLGPYGALSDNNNIYAGEPRRVTSCESNPPGGGRPQAGVALQSLCTLHGFMPLPLVALVT